MANSELVRNVNSSLMVGGIDLPFLNWSVTVAANGSLGTCTATTSIAMLGYRGIDINEVAETEEGAPVDIYVSYGDDGYEHIFGGILDRVVLDVAADTLTIQSRDWGALLVDRKECIASVNKRNQSVAKIVQQIADIVEIDTDITDPGVDAGTEFAGERVLTTHPQPLWSILQTLANQVGYEVRVTPEGVLYFGPPTAKGSVSVSWGAKPGQDAENPLLKLLIEHSPRRNKFFEVRVISYHPRTTQQHSATARNQGRRTKGKQKKPAAVGSSLGKKGLNAIGGRKSGTGGTGVEAVITVYKDGLTQEECVTTAEAIAKDIAKREILVSGKLAGLPDLQVHQALSIKVPNGSLAGYEDREYYISSITHSCEMPQGGGSGAGFTTDFKALTVPEVSSSAAGGS